MFSMQQSPMEQFLGQNLPKIRADLEIYDGPKDIDSMPSWTLHDPLKHQFFRLGWVEFQFLGLWGDKKPQELCDEIESKTTLHLEPEQLFYFVQFLSQNNLTERSDPALKEKFLESLEKKKSGVFWSLIKNYLFFRIPLVHPYNFLKKTLPYVQWIFTKQFLYFSLCMLLVSLYLIFRQMDQFINTFIYSFTFEGFIIYGFAIIFAKIIHECGHAYTATYYGVKVPTMGVAFLVMFPVLYTDTTQIWKVSSRKARLAVGSAGMAAELLLAIYASLLWQFTPPGPIQSAFFALATVTWVLTLIINLSPFLRFDGYYLLSDFLGIENLQGRSFGLAKWQMREFIFHYGYPPSEYFSPRMHKILLIYAYCTWIYRFFLFIGIAFLVYYFFFKVLGILLMLVEVIWFILLPILLELGVWYKMRHKSRWSLGGFFALCLFLSVITFLFYPFQTTIDAPTFVYNPKSITLYPEISSQIKKIHVQKGEYVKKDQLLLELSSLDLTFLKNKTNEKIKILKYQLEHQLLDEARAQNTKVLEQEFEKAITESNGYEKQLQQTFIKAPFDGYLAEFDDHLKENLWINPKWAIGIIIKQEKPLYEAYVHEENIEQVKKSNKANFYPENIWTPSIPLKLVEFDKTNTNHLNRAELSSLNKGDIAIEKDDKNKMVPTKTIYKAVFEATDSQPALAQTQRGTIKIESEAHSIMGRVWKNVASVFIRESGF